MKKNPHGIGDAGGFEKVCGNKELPAAIFKKFFKAAAVFNIVVETDVRFCALTGIVENHRQMRFHGEAAVVTDFTQVSNDCTHITGAIAGVGEFGFRAHAVGTGQGETVFDMDIDDVIPDVAVKFP